MKPNRLFCLILALMLLAVGYWKIPRGTRPSLHEAVRTGDVQKVQTLLAQGADVNAKDMDNTTPLYYAVRYRHKSVAELLLANGADPEIVNDSGQTPLHKATMSGHKELTKLLIAKGANVNATNKLGDTPLIGAVNGNFKDVVALLIGAGADINAQKGLFLNTPLHWAAERGYKPIVQLLIESGARIDSKNRRGETPADLAMNEGRRDIVWLLTFTFRLSAFSGDVEKVRSFIEDGGNVNGEDAEYRTALYLAVEQGHIEVVRLLLANGADPNVRERLSGATPLNVAVEAGQKEMVELLLDHGADVNARYGQFNVTPLQFAASEGNIDLAALLITHGADVNAKYETRWKKSEWTMLHYAIQNGNTELVRLLIDNGARLDDTDSRGRSLTTVAMYNNDRETVELLLSRGAEVTIDLAVYVGDLEKTREFLASDIDINQQDWRGRTLLGIAAQQGHTHIMEELIAKDAEINIKDPNNPARTDCPAIHLAALGGSTDAVKLLISNGANVNSREDSNSTPLHMVAYKGHREVVELLLTNGADINAQDWDGSTPLCWAAQSGHRDIVELLLTKNADYKAGSLGKILTLPDSVAHSMEEITEQIITACKPYSIIVSDPKMIRVYLRYNGIDFDEIWIPQRADLEDIDPALKSHLQKNIVVKAKEHFDPVGVLAGLYLYNREYSGIIRDGQQYIICQMIISRHFPSEPPDNAFSRIHGFANNVVRFVFEVESKKIVQIDCEYIM